MSDLHKIKDILSSIALTLGEVLDIETSVVDSNLNHIAGTAASYTSHAPSTCGIEKALKKQTSYFVGDLAHHQPCKVCLMNKSCTKAAFMYNPIIHNNTTIGALGLVAFNESQQKKLNNKKNALLKLIEGTCRTISQELEGTVLRSKLAHQHTMLHTIANSLSSICFVLDAGENIIFANEHALKILTKPLDDVIQKPFSDYLPKVALRQPKRGNQGKIYSFYQETSIKNEKYSVNTTTFYDDDAPAGTVIIMKAANQQSSGVSKKTQPKIITDRDLLAQSPNMKYTKDIAIKAANNRLNVLLTGESGTGKELIARIIHNMSSRSNGPFIPVNCAAIPDNLLESELFGYEQGAFTSANKGGKPGKMELANGGTIFLDEIGDMSLSLQAKMLRILQDFVVERVGSVRGHHVDVRVIAATNKNLNEMVAKGEFRGDLFFRLNVIPIHIPPLRSRRDDIDLLIDYQLKKFSSINDGNEKVITPETRKVLREYDWPGNVRELENIIQYLYFICSGDKIDVDILPETLLQQKAQSEIQTFPGDIRSLADIELDAIKNALSVYGNTTEGKIKAAEALGIGKTTLYRKLSGIKNI